MMGYRKGIPRPLSDAAFAVLVTGAISGGALWYTPDGNVTSSAKIKALRRRNLVAFLPMNSKRLMIPSDEGRALINSRLGN